ncbi:MAG: hypothetical protein F6K53_40495 [Moorea sp. SIO4A1]|nr:hypothetical protein [Moorena sp. SIO4A1]
MMARRAPNAPYTLILTVNRQPWPKATLREQPVNLSTFKPSTVNLGQRPRYANNQTTFKPSTLAKGHATRTTS